MRERWMGWVRAARAHPVWFVIAMLVLHGCDASTATDPVVTPPFASQPTMVWESTLLEWPSPEDAGFSQAGLAEVRDYVDGLATTGLVVLVGGRVLHWQGNVTELSYLASSRKSVLSALYGRYVADGTIDLSLSLRQLGLDDEGGLLQIEKFATIRDLITARSGVYHPASNAGDATAYAPPRGSVSPGTFFLYNNWDFNAAGAMFELLTGVDIYDALEGDFAIPLGMEDFKRGWQMKSGNLQVSRFPASTCGSRQETWHALGSSCYAAASGTECRSSRPTGST